MASFNTLVNKVIEESDILLMVIDARRVNESINKELEAKVQSKNKKLIYIINKCDLISKQEQSKIRLPDSIQISATKRWGTLRLLKRIMRLTKGKEIVIGVIGYPNTGKSSLINTLKGRHSAPTSPISGFTKSIQKIRINESLMMIDTPGLIPYSEKKSINNIIIGAVDVDKIKDVEGAAFNLIKELDGKVELYFGVEKKQDPSEILEQIALKQNILKKGGLPDTERMARMIIAAWQKGKIK